MLLSKVREKPFLSLRWHLGLVIFVLMCIFSTLLIIMFHFVFIDRAIEITLSERLRSMDNFSPTLAIARSLITSSFWSSLLWTILFELVSNGIVSFFVSGWIAKPIETLYKNLNDAYQRGIPFVSFNDKKFTEIELIGGVVTDMTKKYIDALELQNLFIQDISHELKTPLAAIKSSSDLISVTDKPKPEDYKYYFQTNKIIVSRMINLVNQLTLLNKTNTEIYDTEDVNFSKIVEEALENQEETIKTKNLKINSHIEKDIILKGSAKYLASALSHIFDNAFKFSKDEGNVDIILKKRHAHIILDVIDKGIGISEVDMKNIFNRFYRGENALAVTGSGLGLSIAHKIISAHGGKILLKSKLNQGTEVRIIL